MLADASRFMKASSGSIVNQERNGRKGPRTDKSMAPPPFEQRLPRSLRPGAERELARHNCLVARESRKLQSVNLSSGLWMDGLCADALLDYVIGRSRR